MFCSIKNKLSFIQAKAKAEQQEEDEILDAGDAMDEEKPLTENNKNQPSHTADRKNSQSDTSSEMKDDAAADVAADNDEDES